MKEAAEQKNKQKEVFKVTPWNIKKFLHGGCYKKKEGKTE